MTPAQNSEETRVDEDGLDDVARRGIAIYNEKLRAFLESAHNGKSVAIHLDSGDYALAETSNKAMLKMREIHPEGLLLLHVIGRGSAPGIASRILRMSCPANEFAAEKRNPPAWIQILGFRPQSAKADFVSQTRF
jgi:hypothetical protein